LGTDSTIAIDSLPQTIVQQTLAQLQKYAVFFKTSLKLAEPALTHIGLKGEEAGTFLKNTFSTLPNTQQVLRMENNIILFKIDANSARYELIGPSETITTLWQDIPSTLRPVAPLAWQLADICSGIPRIDPETVGQFLPHRINLQYLNAINLRKGCYVGQEIIARMHYLGKIKQHMYLYSTQSTEIITPGSTIYQDKDAVGYVVDACQTEKNSYKLLVTIADRHADSQTLFLHPANTVSLIKEDLPYPFT